VLAGPAATDLPVIYVGDLNSPADGTGTTYNNAIAAGFVDAWSQAGVGDGSTCCQADDLLNPNSMLSSRIDFILFRGDFTVRSVDVVGEDPANRTPSGLWPSDHAGVVATLRLPRHEARE
jgi:endonuclease/exonuclease/phosphatase family metal-dependent hydrolase